MTVILGIDPGSRITGYGVIQINKKNTTYIDSGCVKTSGDAFADRLHTIFSGISELIQHYRPAEAAIEQVFVHRNAGSALKLGQARGAAMTAIKQFNLPLAEYSARQVKQAVVSYGAATKEQVQQMTCHLLKLQANPQADAADALAIALCHAHTRDTLMAINRMKEKVR